MGARLSGGRQQRMGNTQALGCDSCVQFLDPAASVLDDQTEQGLEQAMSALHVEGTLMIAVWRFTIVSNGDRVRWLERAGRLPFAQRRTCRVTARATPFA